MLFAKSRFLISLFLTDFTLDAQIIRCCELVYIHECQPEIPPAVFKSSARIKILNKL